jgi:hypothetical protein
LQNVKIKKKIKSSKDLENKEKMIFQKNQKIRKNRPEFFAHKICQNKRFEKKLKMFC